MKMLLISWTEVVGAPEILPPEASQCLDHLTLGLGLGLGLLPESSAPEVHSLFGNKRWQA